MPSFIKKTLFSTIIIAFSIVIMIYLLNNTKTSDTNTDYTLKSYKNTVALYSGDEIIEIYDNIVLNTLPQKDIIAFKNGIKVAAPSQAETMLEDYES